MFFFGALRFRNQQIILEKWEKLSTFFCWWNKVDKCARKGEDQQHQGGGNLYQDKATEVRVVMRHGGQRGALQATRSLCQGKQKCVKFVGQKLFKFCSLSLIDVSMVKQDAADKLLKSYKQVNFKAQENAQENTQENAQENTQENAQENAKENAKENAQENAQEETQEDAKVVKLGAEENV